MISPKKQFILALILAALFLIFVVWISNQLSTIAYISSTARSSYSPGLRTFVVKKEIKKDFVIAIVTAFNTVESQTDGNSCSAAAGNICGRDDVIACPREVPLHTWKIIDGKEYECMDRTHIKFNGRYDISFDKDIEAAKNFGIRKLLVYNK